MKRARRDEPLVQIEAAHAQRVVPTLVRTGSVAIHGDGSCEREAYSLSHRARGSPHPVGGPNSSSGLPVSGYDDLALMFTAHVPLCIVIVMAASALLRGCHCNRLEWP